jgi:hypothetical protein
MSARVVAPVRWESMCTSPWTRSLRASVATGWVSSAQNAPVTSPSAAASSQRSARSACVSAVANRRTARRNLASSALFTSRR